MIAAVTERLSLCIERFPKGVPMAKTKINIQDQFLNNLRREKVDVTVRLMSGEEIGGSLKAFDNFCVVVRAGGNYHLIYKHAIAHIRPFEALKKFEAIYENF